MEAEVWGLMCAAAHAECEKRRGMTGAEAGSGEGQGNTPPQESAADAVVNGSALEESLVEVGKVQAGQVLSPFTKRRVCVMPCSGMALAPPAGKSNFRIRGHTCSSVSGEIP